jgi:hypothetical protein
MQITKLSKKNWPEGQELNKKDYLIIAGDFGMIWHHMRTKEEEYWLKWLDDQPWTTLFVDGNHENFDILDNMPEKELFGNKVGIVAHSIFHLRRGIVYRISGQKILTVGGAHSHDREFRVWGDSMWLQEMITDEDIDKAVRYISSQEVMYYVDHVITHCAPPNWAISAMPADLVSKFTPDPSEENLARLRDCFGLEFGKWWFGHYHTDTKDEYGDKWQCLFWNIEELKGK